MVNHPDSVRSAILHRVAELGLDPFDLADQANLDRHWVARWLRGERRLHTWAAGRLLTALYGDWEITTKRENQHDRD